ncbi:MAG: PH domain-containing protein, partial [Candidatus Limnocylindrales bacterium]
MPQPYAKDLLGTSEVVLIETRQHWMAAIRFALRPIVIALIGLGLLALNNIFEFNDDQFLSVINDLITWAVVILFLISIVWIPIDLIRWDSRRYVLTNRRAMLVEGVLQKNSIDSSLGQITDIGMKETTFGRLFGYADITLYTASEAANEVYEQLLDGKQFKIAVLDAKEAIRLGGSMDELPEGFVVKGGTNEASRRADGKIEDEQPEPTPEPPAELAPAASAPAPEAASAPEPEPEPAPETVTAPEPEPEPE